MPRFGRQVKPLKKVIDNSAAVPNSKVEKETPVRKKKETRQKKSANSDWPGEIDLED